MMESRLFHHLAKLLFGIGTTFFGVDQHVQIKKRRKEWTVSGVIQNEFMNKKLPPSTSAPTALLITISHSWGPSP